MAQDAATEGTMMDVPLTIHQIVDRAERYVGDSEVVSRRLDKSLHRTCYRDVVRRARSLARALVGAGVRPGDRIATLMWNHAEHLEAYFGIPLAGGVVHTLNLRLHPDEIAFIATDARDRFLIVDECLLPLYEKVRAKATFERVFVAVAASPVTAPLEDYEAFLAGAPDVALPELREEQALGVCYTSGTTGKPKGVVYTHRSTLLHSLVGGLPDVLGISRADVLLPVVPMFHVNAWGLPYTAAMMGTKLVFPGPHLDPASLLDLMEREKVTVSAGVPTIWIGIRDAIDAAPRKLQPGLRMVVGGSAAPEQLIRDFDRQGLTLVHAWGMTETSPIGLVSRIPPELAGAGDAVTYKLRAKQGVPPPLVDIRIRNEAGDVPADDATSGEVHIRGPWVTARYATGTGDTQRDRWTPDGFFRTGDVARLDQHGFVQLTDRVADLIKSGGEWIASAELETALMCHPAIREAAVIGIAHPKWSERPLAAIVFKDGASATPDELRDYLAPKFAKFWLPDAFVVVDAIPRTSAGKFKKTELRETFRTWTWTDRE
jgi:fatty-acyl-CoA synthase